MTTRRWDVRVFWREVLMIACMRWGISLLPITLAGFALSVSPAQAPADGMGSDESVMIRTARGREMFAVDTLEARTV